MKILNLSFYLIKEHELPAYLARHQEHQLIFSEATQVHEVLHIHHTECDNTRLNNGQNRFVTMTRKIPLETFRFVSEYRPDVIVLHSFNFPLQALILRLVAGKNTRFVVQHHAEQPARKKLMRLLQQVAYKNFSRFIFASSAMALPFVKERICQETRVREMMEISTLFVPEDRRISRERLSIKSETALLWVGRLNANKDPITVLKALSVLRDKNWLMYMIYSENTLEEAVKTYVQQNGLQQNVKMVGYVANQQLPSWYSAADIFISASHYEGSGVALCEAMACDCIPVVTDIPASRFMTHGGSCGYLFSPGDAQALSGLLSKIFDRSIKSLPRRPREVFVEKLSYNAIAKQLAKILTEARQ